VADDIGGIGMAKKKKKAAARKSLRPKKAAKSSKKRAVKKTVRKRAAVKRSKPAAKKKSSKKSALKKSRSSKGGQSGAPVAKRVSADEVEPRKSVAAKQAVPVEPGEADIEEEIGHEELEMEGDLDEDVQEELDLDTEDDGDGLIEKSEDLLDDHDDYRNN
jgi:hypothetical protein